MQLKNLPEITQRYWAAIVTASMCGANTGDFLSHILHLGHWRGLPPLAALFVVILWAESRGKIATETYYWLAIILIRTAATNLADLGTHDFQLGYPLIELGLTLLLALVLLADRGQNPQTHTGTFRRPMLPATSANYWVAMLLAGTLGTASGDFTAGVVGLGLFYGSAVLSVTFAVVLLAAWQLGGMTKPWYWAAIVAARTAGTTLGDMLASRHGFDLGLPVSTAITGSMLAAVVVLWPHRPAVPAPAVR